jgi:RimJ/RimL family protein N-acetyltransferase
MGGRNRTETGGRHATELPGRHRTELGGRHEPKRAVQFWNQGYCSEAAAAIVKFGFENLNLNKITSRHMSTNPASGRVMVKAKLKKEGVLRQEFRKNGKFVDVEVYGVLREDFF